MLIHPHDVIQYFTDYGYYFLVIGLMFEGEVVLLTSTLLSFLLGYSLIKFYFVALFGVLLGNNFWYLLGVLLRGNVLKKYGKYIFLPEDRLEKLRIFFSNSANKALFSAKFMYGMGHVTILAASAMKVSYKKFFIVDFLSSVAWVSFNMSVALILAKYFGISMHNIVHSLKIMAFIILVLFIVQLINRQIFFNKKINLKDS